MLDMPLYFVVQLTWYFLLINTKVGVKVYYKSYYEEAESGKKDLFNLRTLGKKSIFS